ncbi:MAG: MarP family serine protease [Actinobacteria bacterium]|nr:MarP family serine protease [Actinomycetota bacterium]MBV9666294.1 MarP family serine protease [Actinomycetota bacterium]
MDALDAGIVLAAVFAALGGYRLGLLARAASWVGLSAGLVLAARLLPWVVKAVDQSDPATRLLLAAAVLMGGAFIGQGLGLLIGWRVHKFLPGGPLRQADRIGGAVLATFGVFVALWLLLPSMADVPGWPAQQARRSVIARQIDSIAPRPPDTLQALRRLVGDSGFPKVFDKLTPAPVAGPPPGSIALSAAVQARVTASTVKVEGEACHRIQEGSGFAAAPDTIITNAHVVAGVTKNLHVLKPGLNRSLPATVIVFDADRDLAVLRVPNLGDQPLALATGKKGEDGAVFGHPGGIDELRIAPARVVEQVSARGRDLYDQHQTLRDVFILASDLHPGDSGGALADANGNVIAVAFAIAPDRAGTAYALTSKEIRAILAVPRGGPVSTQNCLSDG